MGMLTAQSFSKIEYNGDSVRIGDISYYYNDAGIEWLIKDVIDIINNLGYQLNNE